MNPQCPACGRFVAPDPTCTCGHRDYQHRLDLPSEKCAQDGCPCKRLEVAA